ncbi:hypothetical protein [Larkinella terrae]|uniref:Uncharacterized protein n=1 Tax=Larkinella terrae TaxID=2025311 RepID=A0A7K0EWP1_9BACT|nr:hypothetical protein [Larkinella terrae]MRS65728.1 hypothetical protein [Larkinella terrae]
METTIAKPYHVMLFKVASFNSGLLLLIASIILVQACTVRIPMGQVVQTSHHGAQRIQPSYQVTKKGGRVGSYLGITAGCSLLFGGLGYASKEDKNGNPYTNEQRVGNAKSLALAGLYVGGLYGIYALVRKKKPPRTEQVTPANFNNWLSDYNRKQNQKFVRYGQDTYGYFLIPQNNLAAYEAEEKAIVDRAEAQKRAREEEIIRLAQAKEDSVYRKFRNNPNYYWDTYLTAYPNGRYAEEVRERGEEEAYYDVRDGKTHIWNKNGSWEKYMTFFPKGKHVAIVREYRDVSKGLDAIHDLYFSAKYNSDYLAAKEAAERFKPRLDAWYEEAGKVHREIATSNPLTDLRKALQNRISRIDEAAKEALAKEEARRLVVSKWVIGDNLCWEAESYSTDEKGERIKGTEGKTLIRVTIESISNGGERVQVKVKELYDLKKLRNVSQFTMSSPVRVWRIDITDWIDPREMDKFNVCQ